MTSWQEQFDKEFDKEYPSVRSYTGGQLQDWVKTFIQSLLDQQRKEILEKLTLTKFANKRQRVIDITSANFEYIFTLGYNDAVENFENLKKRKFGKP